MDMDIYISEDNRIISTSNYNMFPRKEHIIFTKPPVIRAEGSCYK